ncbi:hypothetical protein IIF7_20141 [Zunongwangia atlantica 22II14-10F7]|uniref:Uncharacterized protein n=1 Tax=Zunongwangia atlantica 22II14-10F7 TaxID=1185767 RepID=A0A1Y1SYZ1_9FLAO|nr:hypothetical protein IIF7_20141 [Zunongwangia atlantica 22II14-10F7]
MIIYFNNSHQIKGYKRKQLLIIKKELFTNSEKNANQTVCTKKVAKKMYKKSAYGYPYFTKKLISQEIKKF